VKIQARLSSIEALTQFREIRDRLHMEFRELGDIERLVGRFASARLLSPRDFLLLKFALWHLPNIKESLAELSERSESEIAMLKMLVAELQPLHELAEEIDRTINPEAPTVYGQLGVVRDGANTELDELRQLTRSSREKLMEIQARERERTGIASLKVDFNNVFG
jgi:DNA mismatch repair protein MutS